MPLIPFPNVPKAPGVPDLVRKSTSIATGNPLLTQVSGVLWQLLADTKKWGIYDKNGKSIFDVSVNLSANSLINKALTAAAQNYGPFAAAKGTLSTKSVEYAKETRVSDFPIERGSFATYNKAEMASTPVVTLNFSGTEYERTKFLSAIDSACKSTDLYSIITPEVEYYNYSIERYAYRRTAQTGCSMLTVDIFLKEVRQVAASFAATTNAKNAQSKPVANGGKVQAQSVSGSF